MVKYQRSSLSIVSVFILFFVCLGIGVIFVINFKSSIIDSILFCAILQLPTFIMIPYACQRIEFDHEKISFYYSFIKIRTFTWLEVCELGAAYSRGVHTRVEFIYISKRSITSKERNDINTIKLKERKNFITIESRGNIIEEIKNYSKLPFEFLPIAGEV